MSRLAVYFGLLVFVVAMDRPAASFTSLVPSQVSVAYHRRHKASQEAHTSVPKRGRMHVHCHASQSAMEISAPNFNSTGLLENAALVGGKRRRRRRRKTEQARARKTNKSIAQSPKNLQKTKKKKRITGNLPDVHWRAFPMEHLRRHPYFVPLPPAETIRELENLEDVRQFRQESWQWEALHQGRCTTSQAVAALGLLEPKAGKALGVPNNWVTGGGTSAFHKLRKPALRTLEEMNRVLCTGVDSNNETESHWSEPESDGPFWVVPSQNSDRPFPFAAKYLLRTSDGERHQRRITAEKYANSELFISLRMSWGNAQEATAILTGLNYFWRKEPRIVVKEVGMCGAGLGLNSTNGDSSLLVGATPDAVICYPDGMIEALEVKNHCPFVPSSWGKQCEAEYSVRFMPFHQPTVPLVYIPQLMMEMFCLGPDCHSAIMVRQSATNGSIVLRIQRDDDWIEEMLYWLARFQSEFVEADLAPPEDYFWEDEDSNIGDRYKEFVDWTKELGNKVELLDHIKHRDIQRIKAANNNHASFFLD